MVVAGYKMFYFYKYPKILRKRGKYFKLWKIGTNEKAHALGTG